MASSSCLPSSSAVTIPIPGKPILKRPLPTHTGILGRLKDFLSTQPTAPGSDGAHKPLKRAHFILPHLATIYPISTLNPPSTPSLKDEKSPVRRIYFRVRRRRWGRFGPRSRGAALHRRVRASSSTCCVGVGRRDEEGVIETRGH